MFIFYFFWVYITNYRDIHEENKRTLQDFLNLRNTERADVIVFAAILCLEKNNIILLSSNRKINSLDAIRLYLKFSNELSIVINDIKNDSLRLELFGNIDIYERRMYIMKMAMRIIRSRLSISFLIKDEHIGVLYEISKILLESQPQIENSIKRLIKIDQAIQSTGVQSEYKKNPKYYEIVRKSSIIYSQSYFF